MPQATQLLSDQDLDTRNWPPMCIKHDVVVPLSILLLSRGEVSGYCINLKGGGEVIVCQTGGRYGGAEYVSGRELHTPFANAEPLRHSVTVWEALRAEDEGQ